MNNQTHRSYGYYSGVLFLVLAQTMVGVNIVSSKYLLTFAPILFLLMTRFTLAALILWLLHWLTPSKNRTIYEIFSQLERKDWFYIFAQALTAGVLFNFLMLFGLHYTDANVAGIITSALPAMIAVMSWIVLRENISGKKILCVFFATMGLIVIASDKWHGLGNTHSFLGDAIILLAMLPEATYYVLCRVHANRLPVFLISSLLNAINALILMVICLFTYTSWSGLELNLQSGFILFLLGLSSGLFYVFWFFGSQRVDGMMASLSTAVMPVVTVIFAWLFLGELLTLWQLIGMGLVILSIAIYAIR